MNQVQTIYQCSECGLHYTDESTAQKCAVWCKDHKSCNLEITESAIENQPPIQKEADNT